MSDDDSNFDGSQSDDESVEEKSVENIVSTKKIVKPALINHAKQFGGYEEEDSEVDDSEDGDDDEEQVGGVEGDADFDIINNTNIKDDASLEKDQDDSDDSDIEIDEDGQAIEKTSPVNVTKPNKTTQLIVDDDDDDDDDDDEYEENYLQKFDGEVDKNYINEFHPECLNHNSDEVAKLATVIRDENNIIIDPLHRTLPYLSKYEKARILGQRAKQIELGAKPLVKVPENIIDGYLIAELELRENKIPFIIKRPIPGGAFEYWRVKDLENIIF